MTDRLTFRAEIPDDLASAANWYDRQHLGLGDEFLAEYRRTLDMLVAAVFHARRSPKILRKRG